MSTTITYFPVGNGDMTLICLGDKAGTTILIDCNIRAAADDPDDDTRDVAQDLRGRLKRDSKGRPFVDAFLTTHPDADHCRGAEKHFHLGPVKDYPDDKKPDNEKKNPDRRDLVVADRIPPRQQGTYAVRRRESISKRSVTPGPARSRQTVRRNRYRGPDIDPGRRH